VSRAGRRARALACAVACALCLAASIAPWAACGRGQGGAPAAIVVGEVGSLTGSEASFGLAIKRGIELGVDEINNAGGLLGGRPLALVVEDDQGRPEAAATTATKLVTEDSVVAILGAAASTTSLAVAPVCQAARVPMITPSATNAKVTEAGDFIFRVCFTDSFQGDVLAKFAARGLGARRVAILRDATSDYSRGLAETFTRSFAALGGEVVDVVSYGRGDTNFGAPLTRVRGLAPDAVFLPGYYTEAGLAVRQARALGLDMPILGSDGWVSSSLGEIGGAALNDTYLSGHYHADDPSPAIQGFLAAYRARYGDEEPDVGAALGYDAVKVLADAIARAGSTEGPRLRDALAATRDFPGVTGTITMDARRDPIKSAVIVRLVYEDGRLRQEFQDRVGP
jgi:branched-chain amino acid transport system substrate-binding protein